MEEFDREKAARVWERVLKREDLAPLEPRKTDLTPLVLSAQELAGFYHAAARQLGGRDGDLVRGLLRQQKGMAACLKGVCRMRTGAVPAVERPSLSQDAPEALLRRCYEQKLRAVNQYGSRSSDPQFGPVFAHLARQEQEHCRLLLEILGSLK